VTGRASALRIVVLAAAIGLCQLSPAAVREPTGTELGGQGRDPVALGERMYRDGVLPSGESMTGLYAGDVTITGQQVICGTCHRRSGLGSSEGQAVVPAITSDILYQALRLPTRKPPLAPELRPAYTVETLKRAIRDGIGAGGAPLSTLMPRYALSDADLDALIAYLDTLSSAPDPGVTDTEIHFATVVSDSVAPAVRKAVLDVFAAFVEQKNGGTRNESRRAEHSPWHLHWEMGPYRKWVLHVWNLEGPPSSWRAQLDARYQAQPVFALVGGAAPGSWEPVHEFCERHQVPCLFPLTDLPAIDDAGFYAVYLSRGMTLEAAAIAQHLAADSLLTVPVKQVFRAQDPRGAAAAAELRRLVEARGGTVIDVALADDEDVNASAWSRPEGAPLVLWLNGADTAALWQIDAAEAPERIYLSTTLHGVTPGAIPPEVRQRVYLVHPYEVPAGLARLLTLGTRWLNQKAIYAPFAQREQGDALLAMKMVGGALSSMRGFLVRERLIETIEHMVDSVTYTSVYPRISLAPGQRFLSTGAYIAQFEAGDGALVAVTDWHVPDSGAATKPRGAEARRNDRRDPGQGLPQPAPGSAGSTKENADVQI
jgi:hypothetical protein